LCRYAAALTRAKRHLIVLGDAHHPATRANQVAPPYKLNTVDPLALESNPVSTLGPMK
jgi:superfamily I DNA and/or RNA helicase